MTKFFCNKNTTPAAAMSAEAAFSCAHNNAIALILDTITMVSIFVALVLGLSLILADLLGLSLVLVCLICLLVLVCCPLLSKEQPQPI